MTNPRHIFPSVLAAALCVLACSAVPALASKGVVSSFGSEGAGGGQFSGPLGMAVDQSSGDVYVVDSGNNRVQEFTGSGVFVRAFGVNVGGPGVDVCASGCVAGEASGAAGGMSGPQGIAVEQVTGDLYVSDQGNHRVDEFTEDGVFVRAFGWGVLNGKEELQVCTSTCQAGLEGGGAGELGGSVGYLAVEEAGARDVYVADPGNSRVDVFTPAGGFVHSFGWGVFNPGASGTGDLEVGSNEITGVITTSKMFVVGQMITGTGIPAKTTITAVGTGTITLSAPATAKGTNVALSVAASSGSTPANAKQVIAVKASKGTFTLTYTTPAPSESSETTAAIAFKAKASEVQAALEALSNIGAGNVAVTGSEGGPWTVEFKGARYAGTSVNQMEAGATGLEGGQASVSTPQAGGGGLELCTGGCQTGVAGSGAGQFGGGSPTQVAVDSSGSVYAIDPGNGRVQKFDSASGPVATFAGSYLSSALPPGGSPGSIAFEPVFGNVLVVKSPPASSGLLHKENTNKELQPEEQVLEFDSAGDLVGNAGEGSNLPSGSGLAVASSGSLYYSTPNRVLVLSSSPLPAPLAEIEAAGPVSETEATLHGVVNPNEQPPNGIETTYKLQYSTDEVTWTTAAEGKLPAGTSAVPIEATVTTLLPGTTYHTRVLAEREFDAGSGTSATETFTTPAIAPKILEQSATEISATSATLDAEIDPGGAATTYHFEYIDQAGYEQAVAGDAEEKANPYAQGVSTPESLLNGVDDTAHLASAHVQSLHAGILYHYRVVATNALGSIAGEHNEKGEESVQTFTTPTAATNFTLPDGRAYEMVSPPQKNGAAISDKLEGGIIEASANGEKITYKSKIPTETKPVGFANESQDLSTRGASGWATRDLAVPHEQAPTAAVAAGPEYRFFSSDLSRAVVQPFGLFTPCTSAQGVAQPCLSAAASEQTAFLEETGTGGFTPFVTGCPAAGVCPSSVAERANVPAGTIFGGHQEGSDGNECFAGSYCGPFFVAGTPDLSHVLLESDIGLTGGAGANGGLYEASGGELTFVGKGENEAGSESTSNQGAFAAHGTHGISADGSRVIFKGSSEGLSGLLMRDITADEGKGETVKLNENLPESEPQAESANDSRVFFDAGWNGELYVWEQAPGEPLTAGKRTDLTEGKGMKGLVLGASEDGSYVYFVSEGVLAGSGASVPGDNLYVDHHNGTTWKATFITALSSEDGQDWDEASGSAGPWAEAGLQYQPTSVSPNGQYLALMSQTSLTGYDSRDAHTGTPDAEVYLYHAEAGGPPSLTCASCNPTGARPIGIEYGKIGQAPGLAGSFRAWPDSAWVAANVPGAYSAREKALTSSYQPRYLSDDGRLFFDSDDALVPQDVNGTEDVYEYEPEGIKSPEGKLECSASTSSGSEVFKPEHAFTAEGGPGTEAAGCVALISSGSSSEESAFLDASESGGDVFFLTSAKLAPQDQDTAYDVYDAHECTSASPCIAPVTEPPPCDNEASCKASPEPQPSIFGPSGSFTFSGPGNPAPPLLPATKKVTKKTVKCKKGQTKNKKGQCIKKKSHKKKAKVKKSAHTNRRTHS